MKGVLLMNEKEYKNNIVYDAYYLISLFNKDSKNVTQLQVQKIMYFFEAYYMCIKNVDKLYECNFNAWAFGPVAIPLYQKLKIFGDRNIVLEEEQLSHAKEIDDDKKRVLNYIYTVFGDIPAMKLVEWTHRPDSPWFEKWEENNKSIVYGEKSYIDKIKTKNWFRKVFLDGAKES